MENKRAPVQGWAAGIPWDLHMEAYSVYREKYGPQQALIEGGCRGGFHVNELDMFIPGWRERSSAFTALELELTETRQQRDKAEYDRTYAIGAIKSLLRELGEGSRCTRSHPIDQFCEGCSPNSGEGKHG